MKTQNSKDTEKKEEANTKTSGTSKEKATFDQNGKGASDKYGKAGTTPNESGDEHGVGTTSKNSNK
ncbi:hypothetical protein [Pedobacter paludis]|uniref:Uncharacterized protein n=1 Tax=Pedobacter paludis TaxID=2203212 RepID=A0A317F3R5_9SPHI|nr:hypothetical protein [Pedobacter paludis]PWS33784.1 hypothetical protein DF947_04030 [Pedobacter paludis]